MADLAAIGACAKTWCCSATRCGSASRSGAHPRRSGESCAGFLLDGLTTACRPTTAFLAHHVAHVPRLSAAISEAVYDGRWTPNPKNANQALVLGAKPRPALQPRASCSGRWTMPARRGGSARGSTGDGAQQPGPAQSRPHGSIAGREATFADTCCSSPPTTCSEAVPATFPANARIDRMNSSRARKRRYRSSR